MGELEHRLLLAAMWLGTDTCGMRLMEKLSATVGRSVSRGSVYVTLDRMEGKGWIESELSESRLASRSRPADTSFRACRPRTCREVTTSTIRTCLRGASTRWVWNSCLGVRSFERADVGGDRVVVVNEASVDRYFPGCDLVDLERPLGHRRHGDRDVRHDPSHSGCCRAVCRVCADSPGELSRSGWSP